jgi:hypothetical protein
MVQRFSAARLAPSFTTSWRWRWQNILRYFDHTAVFLLIADTSRLFANDDLRGPFGSASSNGMGARFTGL